MIKAPALAVFLSFFLVSTVFAEEVAKSSDSATLGNAKSSRLRMFGQNGASAVLFRDSSCVKSISSSDAEVASGGFGSAFSSFLGTVSNTSLGIAETDTTRNMSMKDGILSKAYFREYEIPAGKPSSMRMGFRDVSTFYTAAGIRYESVSASCRGAISFTPVAGQDYEAGFVWEGQKCSLSINQVVSIDGKTELIPVPVMPAPEC